MAKFITQRGFKDYLKKAVKRGEVYTCTCENCPLAKATGFSVTPNEYSKARHPDWATDSTLEQYDDRLDEFQKYARPLPQWARKFIDVFDEMRVYPESTDARLALFIMDHLEEDNQVLVAKVHDKFGQRMY